MQIERTPYPVEVFTASYQAAGTFTPRGSPANFINDAEVQTISLDAATFSPLVPGARIGDLRASAVYLPKDGIQLLIIANFPAAEASLLPQAVPLICFTDTFAVRGLFHTGAETQLADVLSGTPGMFLPVTDVEIYAVRPLLQDISGAADLLYVNKSAILGFHQQGA